MRHLKGVKKFSRPRAHKKSMFSNMMVSFFENESIHTTAAKAKELRRLSEKAITRAKDNTLHNKRILFSRIGDRDIVAKLFDDIAPRYKDVNGGYTRIIKLGSRKGDGAEMSLLELVEIKQKPQTKQKAKKKEQAKEE
jgi:large subunit ribosomal protein L17